MPKQPEIQPQQTAIVAFPDTTKDEAKELIAQAIEAAKRGGKQLLSYPINPENNGHSIFAYRHHSRAVFLHNRLQPRLGCSGRGL